MALYYERENNCDNRVGCILEPVLSQFSKCNGVWHQITVGHYSVWAGTHRMDVITVATRKYRTHSGLIDFYQESQYTNSQSINP